MPIIKCEICEKEIIRYPSRIKRARHHFCSIKCYKIYRKIKKICSIENCNKIVVCKGLCNMHYTRLKRHGNPLTKLLNEHSSDICIIKGCNKKRHDNEYCGTHAARLRRIGKLGKKSKCSVDGCDNFSMTKGYCEKHYYRFRKYDDPLKLADKEKTKEKQRSAKLKNPTRYWLGKKRPEILEFLKEPFQKGHIPWNKGLKGYNAGDKNSQWLGGKSFEPYSPDFNDELKEKIRKRDNYTCQECGYTEKQLGYKLNIHHIDYDKKNSFPINLISLCKNCHQKTNFDRQNWTKYFQNKIISFQD